MRLAAAWAAAAILASGGVAAAAAGGVGGLTMRHATRTIAMATVPVVVHEGAGSME